MAPLKIMTFNLRHATAQDDENSWEYRRDILFNVITRYQPCIIGTQEGLDFQLDEIIDNTTDYERLGLARDGDQSEYCAILSNTSKLKVLDNGNFWLSETPDSPGSRSWNTSCVRMVTWARFLNKVDNREFYIFNTHFDHVSEEARQQSAMLVWRRISDLGHNFPVFLVGDFHATRGSVAWKFLTGNHRLETQRGKMQDAWLEAEEQIGNVAKTYHGFKGQAAEEPFMDIGSAHIDWILFYPKIKVSSVSVITDNKIGCYPSDHYPVLASFRLL
ncbi:TPA: endonuclease/exonuclease/phosphatase family protein [Candidatus Poribacteria bacterium]|nr:endonuclease/exonuclease/phosphatase family protein [Candidatus Poribacteria bacterium]HIO48801.1 endonuclease/exonuclease/phosphatase family protein [Candidatus Poribacteria bacterium]HIO81501.1 endonuclease/exonuclease/phosphatase family protein [Candidatus Poribacteria bacterium]